MRGLNATALEEKRRGPAPSPSGNRSSFRAESLQVSRKGKTHPEPKVHNNRKLPGAATWRISESLKLVALECRAKSGCYRFAADDSFLCLSLSLKTSPLAGLKLPNSNFLSLSRC